VLVLGGEDVGRMHRSRAAAAYYRARQRIGLPVPKLLLSGGAMARLSDLHWLPADQKGALAASGAVLTEAQCMGLFFHVEGMKDLPVRQEQRATSTVENMLLSARHLTETDTGSVVLVTDAFHAPRSVWLYRKISGQMPDAVVISSNKGTLRLRVRERVAWAWSALRLSFTRAMPVRRRPLCA